MNFLNMIRDICFKKPNCKNNFLMFLILKVFPLRLGIKMPPVFTSTQYDYEEPNQYKWKGNGNPFQCSCLEYLMDRGVWLTTVYRVTKS